MEVFFYRIILLLLRIFFVIPVLARRSAPARRRENGNPGFIEVSTKYWIPAFAGMTDGADMVFVGIVQLFL